MAELLAEALIAYQAGLRSEALSYGDRDLALLATEVDLVAGHTDAIPTDEAALLDLVLGGASQPAAEPEAPAATSPPERSYRIPRRAPDEVGPRGDTSKRRHGGAASAKVSYESAAEQTLEQFPVVDLPPEQVWTPPGTRRW